MENLLKSEKATDHKANLFGSLWMIASMAAFAVEDTLVKMASQTLPVGQILIVLGLYGFLSVVLAGVLFSLWQGQPFLPIEGKPSLYLLVAVIAGVSAYYSLMKAMRTGEVAAVTPFRYTRLIFGVALGIVWFGEQLSASMLMGCGLIVVSGLFILWRGRQVSSQS